MAGSITTAVPPSAPLAFTARSRAACTMYCICRSIVVCIVDPGIGGTVRSSPFEIASPSADSSTVRSPGVPASTSSNALSSPAAPLPSTFTNPSTCGASAPAG